jgi:hydroxymethylpyrimidine pyrophosphatase-like HAD family hydrolase
MRLPFSLAQPFMEPPFSDRRRTPTAEVDLLRYTAIAFDYDGTLAKDGVVSPAVIEALRKIKESGRKLLIVSGRILEDLQTVFEHFDLFDKVVLENGAVIYTPSTGEIRLLAEPAPAPLVEELSRLGAKPAVGLSIVATWTPFEKPTLDAIQMLGLEHAVIFNKGAVMVLPSGVNKASGLKAALDELGLSAHNVITVGDAENDHAMMSLSEFAVAVSNALPAVQDRADLVTVGDHGDGIIELCEHVLATDLLECAPARHKVNLGRNKHSQIELDINAFGPRILICGAEGVGKSVVSETLVQNLHDQNYQICIVDPMGTAEPAAQALLLGSAENAASGEEIAQAINRPENNVSLNLSSLSKAACSDFVTATIDALEDLRETTGRPHWLVLHDVERLQGVVPYEPPSVLMITSKLRAVSPKTLDTVDIFIAIGDEAFDQLNYFAEATGRPLPYIRREQLDEGDALIWFTETGEPPVVAELQALTEAPQDQLPTLPKVVGQ